jgi:adhesin transport system outer membrane protein
VQEQASRRIAELEAVLATAEKERDDERVRSAVKVDEIEALRSETAELRNANQQLQASAEAQAEVQEQTDRRIADLEAVLATTDRERDEAQLGSVAMSTQIEALGSETAELRDANQQLQASVEAQAEAQDRYQRRIAELEEALTTAETQRSKMEAERADLESERSEPPAKAAVEAQRQIENLDSRLQAAEAFLATSESKRRELVEQLSSLKQEHEALQARLSAEPGEAESQLASPLQASPSDDTAKIMEMVNAWAEAWSKQEVEDYLAFYASTFVPAGGKSRAEWESQRRKLVLAPSRISIGAALRDLRITAPERAEAEFLQSYSSDRYSDVVVKTLELVMESGRWRIARERSE